MRRLLHATALTALSVLTFSCAETTDSAENTELSGTQQALEGSIGTAGVATATVTQEPDAWERSQADAVDDDRFAAEDTGLHLGDDFPGFDPTSLLEGAIATGYSECENYRLWTAIGAPVPASEREQAEVPQK